MFCFVFFARVLKQRNQVFIFSFRVDTKPRGKPERKLDNDEERDRPGAPAMRKTKLHARVGAR